MPRIRIPHLTALIACTCAVACAFAPTANAWQAIILPSGTDTVDVVPGGANEGRAIFTSLPRGASLDVTLGGGLRADSTADLYIPYRDPERGRMKGQLPELRSNADTLSVADANGGKEEEPSTGLRFQHVSSLRLPKGMRAFQIASPDAANRALVVIHDDDAAADFELDHPASTPRTVARLRAWYDTPADGKAPRATHEERSTRMVLGALLGAGIVVAMLALAVWWGVRGRSAARRPRHDT